MVQREPPVALRRSPPLCSRGASKGRVGLGYLTSSRQRRQLRPPLFEVPTPLSALEVDPKRWFRVRPITSGLSQYRTPGS
jgi:hypothetical protein